MVLDHSKQLHTRGDGQTTPVCHWLLPATPWGVQGALSPLPNHFFSGPWKTTHCTYLVSVLLEYYSKYYTILKSF